MVFIVGDATCPVANCNEVKYNAHIKNDIKFADFIDYLKDFHDKEHNTNAECLYLKDWHFVQYVCYILVLYPSEG